MAYNDPNRYTGAELPEWLSAFYNRNNVPVAPVAPTVAAAPQGYRTAPRQYYRGQQQAVLGSDSGGDDPDVNPNNVDLSGLWSSGVNNITSEVNSFMKDPLGAIGFDTNSNDPANPFSNVGEMSKNIGKAAGLSTLATGPLGMAVEGVAGLFETSALNDMLKSMNAEELDVFDVAYAALSPTGTLRDEAMESFDKGIMTGNVQESPWSRAANVGSDGWNQMDESWDRQNNYNASMDAWDAHNGSTQDNNNNDFNSMIQNAINTSPTQDPNNVNFNAMIQNAINTPVAPNPAPVTVQQLPPIARRATPADSGSSNDYSPGDFDDGNSGAGDFGGGYSDESGYGNESQDSDW